MAHDQAKATEAINNTITGCNECHAASTSSEWSSYGFVQIQLLKTNPADDVNWNVAVGTRKTIPFSGTGG